MTEQEAIKVIMQKTCGERPVQHNCTDSCLHGKDKCAFAMAIAALEKKAEYKTLEEQGLLLRLPCKVCDVVDKLFSHNEIVALWIEKKKEMSYHELVWNGMAWDIPAEFQNCKFVKIFGTIPMAISEADHINIEVVLSEEAEAALEKMKGGAE